MPTPRVLEYPGSEASFGTLLKFHMARGTRPSRQRQVWTQQEFATACGVEQTRTVFNWRKDAHLPVSAEPLLNALFGRESVYLPWRVDLGAAHARGRGGPPKSPDPQEPDVGSVIARAAAEGIPEAAVRRVVEQCGGATIEKGDLIPFLLTWIYDAKAALARHVDEDEAFKKALEEAKRRFSQGLPDAGGALISELAREEREEAARREERRARRIRMLEEALRFDEVSLNIHRAVQTVWQIAEMESAGGEGDFAFALAQRAADIQTRGIFGGQNAALLVAAGIYRRLLETLPDLAPGAARAAAHVELGRALLEMGKRETGDFRLKEALNNFGMAKALLGDGAADPRLWGNIHIEMASALRDLGFKESGTVGFEQSVASARVALTCLDRNTDPLGWSHAQNVFGNALQALGMRKADPAVMEEALATYQSALEAIPRADHSHDWAATQTNIGTALRMLGQREAGTERLRGAVRAFRSALEEDERTSRPLAWATAQNNLANALRALGDREGSAATLREAIEAYRSVLEIATRERAPSRWAGAQNNLGHALYSLARLEPSQATMSEAITAYRAALEEHTREREPRRWTIIHISLGHVLLECSKSEREPKASIAAAIEAYKAARPMLSPLTDPMFWGELNIQLGTALATMALIAGHPGDYEEAIDAFRAAAVVPEFEEGARRNAEMAYAALNPEPQTVFEFR